MMNNLEIRPASQSDYASIAAIHNATWTDHPVTAEELERVDAKRTAQNFIRRFMLEFEAESVSEASLIYSGEHQFHLELNVLPKFQSRGFGKAFYRFLESELERHAPERLFCNLYEIHPFALDFAQTRGFKEVMRVYHQTLKLAGFDAEVFAAIQENLIANGYRISSLADLQSDSNSEQKLYELFTEVDADVPRVRKYTPIGFEEFKRHNLQNPSHIKTACFVAIKNGEWVGLSQCRARPNPSQLHTGMTGVLREHRGQNLALGLKLAAIQYAMQNGFTELHSNNASTNAPMLAVNKKLGFERSQAQIQLEKNFNQT